MNEMNYLEAHVGREVALLLLTPVLYVGARLFLFVILFTVSSILAVIYRRDKNMTKRY